MPSPHPARNLTPRLLEMVVLVVDGNPVLDVAARLGVSPETVKSALVVTRQHLRNEGYTRTHTTIGLRKALRARGDIDHLEKI